MRRGFVRRTASTQEKTDEAMKGKKRIGPAVLILHPSSPVRHFRLPQNTGLICFSRCFRLAISASSAASSGAS